MMKKIDLKKIEFKSEFLEGNISDIQNSRPRIQEELNKRIDESESDFLNDRYKTSTELLAKYQ